MDHNKYDWVQWPQDMFKACIEAIQECDPVGQNREWRLYWQLLQDWKYFREQKAHIEREIHE